MRLSNAFIASIFVAAAAIGCGGGGGGAQPPAESVDLAEGIATEEVPPEDRNPPDGSLVPPTRVVVTPGTGGTSPGTDWVVWPESLATHVLDVNNVYANSNQALSWPSDPAGIYSNRSDCSGFVTRSLMKAFQLTPDNLQTWMGSKGPSSARYHDNILDTNNFQLISKASDVRRGDIVAVKYLDNTSGGTGHTMIVASPPVQRVATAPSIPGTVQYDLLIIDSTSSPHGAGDTRKETAPDGKDQDGAGTGTIRLYADASSGAITGYTWSRSSGSKYFTSTSPATDRRSLVVGRMTFAH